MARVEKRREKIERTAKRLRKKNTLEFMSLD